MTDTPLPDGWERLTAAEDGHCFFGYYDRNPWNADTTLHLALRIAAQDHMPQPGETADVGVVSLADRRFRKLATTRAWNHQQGAMTMWLPHRPDCFVFNDWDADAGRMIARICSVSDGLVGTYDRPLYAMSPDGRWGASLDFARIPRRGYSYADTPLDTSPVDMDGDGIFIVDMATGESRLIASYRQILAIHPALYTVADKHSWLNHIIFNCDSSRLLFLIRHCGNAQADDPWPWMTHMYTVDVDGGDLRCPLPNPYWIGISHQIWGRTPHEILVDANWQQAGNEYVVFDERILPLQGKRLSKGMGPAGHLVFSPDGRELLADTYPVDQAQTISRVNAETGACIPIGRFRHIQEPGTRADLRCDLHPRWSGDGRFITVDSIHDGSRAIYLYHADTD